MQVVRSKLTKASPFHCVSPQTACQKGHFILAHACVFTGLRAAIWSPTR